MSVRRLAEDTVQPEAFKFNRANGAWAKKKLKDYPKGREQSAVIPFLMRAQEQEGWVTKAAIEHVAEMLDMPLIRVLEVATFYTQFQLAPVGKRAHIQVCGTTPCMLRGSEELMDICKKRIAPKPFELSEDGNMSWEEVECQGACVNAPMIMIFKDSYEDLTAERFEEIIDQFESGKGNDVPVGPQIDRIYSAPHGGLTSLTSAPTVKKAANVNKKKASEPDKPMKATKAARPASHVAETSPALKTPVSRSKAKVAVDEATKARKEAGTRSPKKRAQKIAGNIGGNVTPAKMRTPSPSAIKAEKGKPEPMRKPSKPDDLKLISGVGPKLEKDLNKLGIYKFEQIAQWKKAEATWVGGHFGFAGRIERDQWVRQAKALAKKTSAKKVK